MVGRGVDRLRVSCYFNKSGNARAFCTDASAYTAKIVFAKGFTVVLWRRLRVPP